MLCRREGREAGRDIGAFLVTEETEFFLENSVSLLNLVDLQSTANLTNVLRLRLTDLRQNPRNAPEEIDCEKAGLTSSTKSGFGPAVKPSP